VGVALSPEYIYSIRPGEIIPDDRRFGVFWMERRALASAFDMEGGFNDLAIALAPGTSPDECRRARGSSAGAVRRPRGDLPRAAALALDARERAGAAPDFGFIIPLIFLGVAAFILNVAMVRALALQRPQIAALKALGYSNASLAWHYLKWALLIAAAGIVLGIAAGAWLGGLMIDLYNQYFRFPTLLYRLSPDVVLGATAMTLTAAVLGALAAVLRAVRIPPAEAMRPEPPAIYHRTAIETPWIGRHLGNAGRMVIRNIARHPLRAAASVIGVGFAGAILVVGFVFIDAMSALIITQFSVAERQDVTVNFMEPRSARTRYALEALPGVLSVEPQRVVAARLRTGHRQRNLRLIGTSPDARLKRIVDQQGQTVSLPTAGLVLSRKLADVLGLERGDIVTVEVLEGRRPVGRFVVADTVDDTLGLSAYMDLDALHGLMRESRVVTGAALLVDGAMEDVFARHLKGLPAVAGAGFRRAVVQSFRDTLAANMNIMIWMNVVFAGIIAFGVVYNAARVSLSERSRELASLRVLGFTRAEISLILLGELAVLTLAALPVGAAIGYGMAVAVVRTVDSEVYRFPLIVTRSAIAWSFLTIIAGTLVSGLVVRRRLDRLDLVAVLKIPE
jgi:putative ABC transport system permease protein